MICFIPFVRLSFPILALTMGNPVYLISNKGAWGVWPVSRGLIDYLLLYVPLKNCSLIWRRHHCRWRAAKFRPMLSAQGLWAGRDLYRATPSVTRDLSFSGLIRRTAPISRLLRHAWGCRGLNSNPDPHGVSADDADAHSTMTPGPGIIKLS
jgi:hypothetical protein